MEEESNDALCNKGDFVLSGFSILFLFKILKSVYNDSIAHYIFYIVLFIFVVLLFSPYSIVFIVNIENMEQIIVIDSATRTTLNFFVTSIYFYYNFKSIVQQRREVISIYLYSAICISGYRYRHKIHSAYIEFKYKLKKRSNFKKRFQSK